MQCACSRGAVDSDAPAVAAHFEEVGNLSRGSRGHGSCFVFKVSASF